MGRSGRFFFVLFSLLRFSLNIGVVERPLVQGLVWGLVTGDMGLSLSVSAVFELLWLDLIPAGTFIPPNMAASNLAALALIHFFGYTQASEVVYPILLCLPLAWVGARLEYVQRHWQNASYNRLLKWTKPSAAGDYAPRKLILGSLLQVSVLQLVFFMVSVLVLISLVGILRGMGLLQAPSGEFLTWGHLWLAASFGGLLSLRTGRAYAMLFTGAGVITLVSCFWG